MSKTPEKSGIILKVKLFLLFFTVMIVPIVILTFIAWDQSKINDHQLRDISVEDAKTALRNNARSGIERIASDTAEAVAQFLYQRDQDVLLLAGLMPSDDAYAVFSDTRKSMLTTQGEWKPADDGMSWVEERPSENSGYFFPLYDEITFIDTDGIETAKYVTSGSTKKNFPLNPDKRDVSKRANTYIKAETYWEELKTLKSGEIYVSGVTGAYVSTNYLGMYTPEVLKNHIPASYPTYGELKDIANLQAEAFMDIAKQQAFSGLENPVGQRFEGIVRWASPVTDYDGSILGYVTMALNHDHIMEFVSHITPMPERYSVLSNAYDGNYAFIWDHTGQSLAHPRHQSIAGFDPVSGEPQTPWLDSRHLSNARRFAEWEDLTENGGSGSFYTQWNDKTMLIAAGSIPYYTGSYAPENRNGSKRGFAFIAVEADIEAFTIPAVQMEDKINEAVRTASHESNIRLLYTSIFLLLFAAAAAVFAAMYISGKINFIRGL